LEGFLCKKTKKSAFGPGPMSAGQLFKGSAQVKERFLDSTGPGKLAFRKFNGELKTSALGRLLEHLFLNQIY
jgi:hypothetical protein